MTATVQIHKRRQSKGPKGHIKGLLEHPLHIYVLADALNQYQGGMCISVRLTTTERTPRHLISPLGPNWVGTDSAV